MNTFKMLLSYNGASFKGWQKQKHTSQTLQQLLETTLSQRLNESIALVGSGRTDAGVHAIGQVAHFKTAAQLPSSFLHSINSMLPETVVVKNIWQMPSDFHALHSAEQKTYKYLFWNGSQPNPFYNDFSFSLTHKPSLKALNDISSLILGERDFKSFQTSGTPVPSTLRRITRCEWKKKGSFLVFTVTGNGFLKQMVRNMLGTILFLERHKRPPSEILSILEACDRQKSKTTLAPQGLYLFSVKYPKSLDKEAREI